MNSLVAFVGVTYVLSVALSVLVGGTGGQASPLLGIAFVSMAFPAIAVLVVGAAYGERLDVDWRRIRWTYIPVALLLIPLVMHAVMLPVTAVLEGRLPWQSWLSRQGDGLFHTAAERDWGVLTGQALAVRILVNAVIGLIVVSILAIFEEVGWRAWLLPRLIRLLGNRRALLATAVIAAVWHLPYAASGIHHLEGVDPAITASVMTVGHVGAGLVIGWMWLRTESMWIVALAHGALNNWGQYAFKFMEDFATAPDWVVLGAGNAGLLVVGLLLLLFGVPLHRVRSASSEGLPTRVLDLTG